MKQISHLSVIETTDLGKNVAVSEFAIIRRNVTIGDNVIIHPHVIINENASVSNDVEIFPGAIIGKEPIEFASLDPSSTYAFQRKIKIGPNCSIGAHTVLYYDLAIGEETIIGDGASIYQQCRIGSRCLISRGVTVGRNTRIGDRTRIMDLSHLAENSDIGDDVFVSSNVGMANDNLPGGIIDGKDRIKGLKICDGAVIGAGATLLPGIIIGKNAAVGAGAVVTRDVPDGARVMGTPARFTRPILSEAMVHDCALLESEHVGAGTRIWAHTHILPGARIGKDCNICDQVFIENDVVIGDRVTVKSGVHIWDGARIKDDVFIGPNVAFTNDRYPRSKQYPEKFLSIIICKGASIGANATLLPGITIGENAMVGAGAVVVKDVPPNALVVGNPALFVRYVSGQEVSENNDRTD